MNPNSFYRTHLREHQDANGDLAPPWARFPSYERGTIGWRMGAGEDWLSMWFVFAETLAPEVASRIAYLQRHPPAPVTWADWVHNFLYPAARGEDGDDEEDDAVEEERRAALRRDGLIASDVAYPTWLSQQTGVRWPWERAGSPEEAARYWTREFWFWSRQVAGARSNPGWQPPEVPARWQACADPLRRGVVHAPDVGRGLLSLAQMLSAGRVLPPWQLGLTIEDFADSFENDMGYVDAFRLWGMSSFDDREYLEQHLTDTAAPETWRRWTAEQFHVA